MLPLVVKLYDILQSFIIDEPTDFTTQVGKLKGDFQREAVLQSFFAKVPGLHLQQQEELHFW